MPEARIAKCCVVLLFGEEPNEIQSKALGQGPKYLPSHKDYSMPSIAESQGQPDVGVNVASAACANYDCLQKLHQHLPQCLATRLADRLSVTEVTLPSCRVAQHRERLAEVEQLVGPVRSLYRLYNPTSVRFPAC